MILLCLYDELENSGGSIEEPDIDAIEKLKNFKKVIAIAIRNMDCKLYQIKV